MILRLSLLVFTCMFCLAGYAQAIKVEVKKEGDKYQLYRGGKPYYIKGAGGHEHLELLKECGGNSIRTWGHDGAKKILDEAHELGITVTIGLWMGHERHGFDYDDKWAVKGQLENFRKVVKEFKDHPALLMWGIGNEVDLFYTNFKVWDAVGEVAAMIKEIDPNHPTMTVTAGIDVAEIQLIQERAPDIDIMGINSYGGIVVVPDLIRQYGWDGPYAVTEWGPNGQWEVFKTKWDAAVDVSSTEKANTYQERYEKFISADEEHCIGSYVFLWGQKQEVTATWFSLFSEEGMRTEAIERMQYCWSGTWPDNRSPQIKEFKLDGKTAFDNISLEAGKPYEVVSSVSDPDGDDLVFKWEILPENEHQSTGGDKEYKPQAVNDLIVNKDGSNMTFKAPKQKGAYRLFLFAYDGHDHMATVNYPFYVE